MISRTPLALVIVARLNSSRLYGKALLPLVYGMNSLDLLYKRLSKWFGECSIIVATSDCPSNSTLVNYCKHMRYRHYIGSDKNVLGRIIEASRIVNPESVIVRVTADNPLTDPYTIELLYKDHIKINADYTYSPQSPNGLRAEIISRQFACSLESRIKDLNKTEYLTHYLVQPLGQIKNSYDDRSLSKYSNYDFTVDYDYQYNAISNFLHETDIDSLINDSTANMLEKLTPHLGMLPSFQKTDNIDLSEYNVE
jgi:spore coat polysaccharide biosynthesis protein SpsF (cytidylyltransferase family)